ncbi:MAG: hypothetical protein WBE80_06110 [Methylocella sp.]
MIKGVGMKVKFLPASVAALSDRQIRVMASTEREDHVGDIMVAKGARLAAYKKNPIVLWQHDPSQPIGNADISVVACGLAAVITFAGKKREFRRSPTRRAVYTKMGYCAGSASGSIRWIGRPTARAAAENLPSGRSTRFLASAYRATRTRLSLSEPPGHA